KDFRIQPFILPKPKPNSEIMKAWSGVKEWQSFSDEEKKKKKEEEEKLEEQRKEERKNTIESSIKSIDSWDKGLDSLDESERLAWEQQNANKIEGKSKAW